VARLAVPKYSGKTGAAGSIAKCISAYDMAVSETIYGHTLRYVSRERLRRMLDEDHEKKLLRLSTAGHPRGGARWATESLLSATSAGVVHGGRCELLEERRQSVDRRLQAVDSRSRANQIHYSSPGSGHREQAPIRHRPQDLRAGLGLDALHEIVWQPAEQGEVLANLLAGHAKLLGDLPVAAGSTSRGGFVPASFQDGIRRSGEECLALPGALAGPAFESKCLE